MSSYAAGWGASRETTGAFGTNSVGYDHFVVPGLTEAGLPLFFTPDVFPEERIGFFSSLARALRIRYKVGSVGNGWAGVEWLWVSRDR